MSDTIRALAAGFIRDQSRKGLVSSETKVAESLDPEIREGFYISELSDIEEYTDISRINGKNNEYWYSTEYMTANYAELAVMLEEKDTINLIVNTVRRDSKLYPRSTAVEVFEGSPYYLKKEEIEAILLIVDNNDRYSDIEKCITSIDTVYLFSTESMPRAQAEYISEWDAVGQYENQ